MRSRRCCAAADAQRFDELFDLYWRRRGVRKAVAIDGNGQGKGLRATHGRRTSRPTRPARFAGARAGRRCRPARPARRRQHERELGQHRPPAHRRPGRDGARRGAGRAIGGPAALPADPTAPAGRARPPARSAPHHPAQPRTWRQPDRASLPPPPDQAVEAGAAARRIGVDEPVQRAAGPLPQGHARPQPRCGSLRVPHQADPCQPGPARTRYAASDRADGADRDRVAWWLADRRLPRKLQPRLRQAG